MALVLLSYNLKFDKDCNGLDADDIIIELVWSPIGTKNNCPNNPQALDVRLNGASYTTAYQGKRYCESCQDSSWGHYAEYAIDLHDLVDLAGFDPCDCDCGRLGLADAGSFAGGSFNSKKKDGFDILVPNVDVQINACPEADFGYNYDPACRNIPVTFWGDWSTDTFPLYDQLSYEWNFGDGGSSTEENPIHVYATVGTYFVTLTVTDTFGCVDEITKAVEVINELTSITIVCPPDVTINCEDSSHPDNTGYATIDDPCDPNPVLTYEDVIIPGSCPHNYTIERTWTGTNFSGGSISCVQLIHVQDIEPPLIVCPTNVTIECDQSTFPVFTGYATSIDNCTLDPIISYTDLIIAGACPDAYAIDRTWYTEDECGNWTDCVQRITVRDITAPVISCPSNVTVYCTESTTPAELGFATATDNCTLNPLISHYDFQFNGSCPQEYTIERVWDAEDDCGNISSCTQVIQVVDNEDPVITCPANVTLQCDQDTSPAATGTATATDDCTDPVTDITYQDFINTGNCPYDYSIERTWTATDACGNQSQCIQTIFVEDTMPPVIACPANLTIQCDQDLSPIGIGAATATDNCTDPVTDIIYQDNIIPGNCPNNYTIQRSWTATDECGNYSQCTQIITVQDTMPPIITCPTNLTLQCDQDTTPLTTGSATATDNCTAPITNIVHQDSIIAGNCPNNYTIERTWTATDECGNAASCLQTITVEDTTPPVITCPADVTIECDQSTFPVITGYATSTDNCTGDPTLTYTDVVIPGLCPDAYAIDRTWYTEDECGNWSECVQRITIRDVTDPVVSCPPNVTVNCTESTDPADLGFATATDNCTLDPSITYFDFQFNGSCVQEYTIERVWDAEDNCGNIGSCTQIIEVVDTTPPVITCPANLTIECDQDTSPAATGTATATDNCTDPVNNIVHADSIIPGNCPNNYTIERTWTATDQCGNAASCIQIITVEDTTPPVITSFPEDVFTFCTEDTSPSNTGEPTAVDECSEAQLIYIDSLILSPCEGEALLHRKWAVEDECGNKAPERTQVIGIKCYSCMEIVKNVVSGPLKTNNNLEYEITYRIIVQNTGMFEYEYDLIDSLKFGTAFTIIDASSQYEAGDGQAGQTIGFLGSTGILSQGELLMPYRSDSFLVNVTFKIDPNNLNMDEVDCNLKTGQVNAHTGVLNKAAFVDTAIIKSDTACIEFLATVGDFVWLDNNQDGIQDPGEVGVADITVELYSTDSSLISTTKTDKDGYYTFHAVPPEHEYFIKFGS